MFYLTKLSVAHIMSDHWQINKCSRGLQKHFRSGSWIDGQDVPNSCKHVLKYVSETWTLTQSGDKQLCTSSSSSSYICHGVGPLVDPFRSHVLSGSFPWDLSVVKISPEWVTGPEQGKSSGILGLLPLSSGPACIGKTFPPFLMKQLYRCDSVVISSFVRTGYTARRWGWLLGRIGHSSVSQTLWDRGPVNSFYIRRGPGPNKFTRKYLSNFFKFIH